MATHRPGVSTPESGFGGQLLAEREVAPRAQVIAQQAAALLEGCAINVYVYNEDEVRAWQVKGRVGEATVEESYEAATLTRLAETREPLLFSGASLAREYYAHLDVRRTIASLAYVPILLDEVLIGAIEAISFDRVLDENDIETLDELTELSALALATGLAHENERNSNLDSITRLWWCPKSLSLPACLCSPAQASPGRSLRSAAWPVPLPDGLSRVASYVRFSPQREKNSSFEAGAPANQ